MYYISKTGLKLERAHSGDAGWDLRYSGQQEFVLERGSTTMVETGIHIRLNPGTFAMCCSRSGLAAKYSVFVLNAPGIIDSGYRGECKVILHNAGMGNFLVKPGDRIAQLVILGYSSEDVAMLAGDEQTLLDIDKEEADRYKRVFGELPQQRGTAGFGSTGVK